MTQSLRWRPTAPPVEGTLPFQLKAVLDKHSQLTLYGPRVMNKGDLDYLRGLADADVPGAKGLIDLIEKYESITLFIE